MGNTILVTGGAGFIGSHLCETLLRQGETVVTVDNFNNFYDPQIKYRNVEEIMKTMEQKNIPSEKFTVITGDIRDCDTMDRVFSQYQPRTVVHLAAMAGVRPSIEQPLLYEDVNIKGTLNILEMCRKYNINSLVFASSSSVYGNNKKVPFSEDDSVDNPISPYAATKKAGELLCYTYHSLYDINVACLRFFTVYGPRQRPDLAIHKFAKLIMEEENIPFFGDGVTQRDYTYVEDTVDGVIKAVKWTQQVNKQYEIFNIGKSYAVSLTKMVEILEKEIGRSANKKFFPMQQGDVIKTFANISKAKKVLGYEPLIGFKKGIQEFMKWYKQSLDACAKR